MIRFIIVVLCLVPITLAIFMIILLTNIVLFPFRRLRNDIAHTLSSFWGTVIFGISGAKFDIQGMDRYDTTKPYIIMLNHQSAFDIFLLFRILKGQFRWISKDTYFKLPVVGWSMKAAGYVSVKREKKKSAYESMLKAGDRLKEGRSVAIFPEGTRSKDGMIKRFKPGIFLLTERYPDVPILPIVVHGTIDINKKGNLAIRPTTIHVRVLEDVSLKDIPGTKHDKIEYLEKMMKKAHAEISGYSYEEGA